MEMIKWDCGIIRVCGGLIFMVFMGYALPNKLTFTTKTNLKRVIFVTETEN